MKLATKIVLEDLEVIASKLENQAHKLEDKTVLVTGGAGFLGNYLVLTLLHLNNTRLKRPVKVISLDNFITGLKKPLINIKGYRDVTLVEHDVSQPFKTSRKIDYILHAAGIASPVYYKKYPIQAIDVATQGTKNFLNIGREKKIKSFVFFSSSEIYGDPHPDYIPTPETYRGNVSSTGPRSCYDESKRLGEALAMAFWHKYRSPIKIIRPFNVFGPGMKYNDFRVIPAFLMSGLSGKTLRVHGTGKQTRTFCYITDAIEAIYKVLLSRKSGEVYNIGNDKNEISMIKLAREIDGLIKRKIRISKINYPSTYPADEPMRRAPDLSKIKLKLKYNPQVDYKIGIKRLKDWYISEYKIRAK